MKKRKIDSILKIIAWLALIICLAIGVYCIYQQYSQPATITVSSSSKELAVNALNNLEVKAQESGEDYDRGEFLSSWGKWVTGCNVRQKILNRDVKKITHASNGCTVTSGELDDPYSGEVIELRNKSAVTHKVQIDHVVALSNAWRTGAQHLSEKERNQLANDDLELIAVSSQTNQDKSDGDASEWLPENTAFHCEYIARQIAVKIKYHLWVTASERNAMVGVLKTCPDQKLPAE